jgi:hypothetical protein
MLTEIFVKKTDEFARKITINRYFPLNLEKSLITNACK